MKKIITTETILSSLGAMESFFKRGNIATYTARTAEEILNVQGVRKADVIIAEAGLPLMGGARLCAAIRNEPALRQVSLILVADGSAASRNECATAHANAVLESPVDPGQLFLKISELIQVPQRHDIRSLLHVSLHDRPGGTFLGVTKNISISGLLIETDRKLAVGEKLACVFSIGGREISTECAVMRAERTASDTFRYGVMFSHLDTKAFVIIDQFVKGGIKL
jgi:CheY-like chemotaxis protein